MRSTMSSDPVGAFRRRLALLLSGFTIMWGLWVVMPWSMQEVSDVWVSMVLYMPEWLWGTNSIIAGVLLFVGWTRNAETALYWGLGVAIVHWVSITIAYIVIDYQSLGGITALFLTLLLVGCYDFESNTTRKKPDVPRHLRP